MFASAPNTASGPGPKNTQPLLTPRIYAEMLKKETGQRPSGFYLKLFSRESHRDDRERQAMEMYGDRVLDLAIAGELARERGIVDVGLLEIITRIKSDNKNLTLYARRIGLDRMTGACEKDLADRVEMLVGFAFQHSGFNTVIDLLNFDGRNTLIPSEEAVILAQSLWKYRPKNAGLPKLLRHEDLSLRDPEQPTLPFTGKKGAGLHREKIRQCASLLGKKAISLGLLTFVRDEGVFRTASILGKARELIEVCRALPENDLRHGLTEPDGKRGARSVFSAAHELDVGLAVMKNGALQEARRVIADRQLREKMQLLMRKFVDFSGTTRNVITNRVTTDFLN